MTSPILLHSSSLLIRLVQASNGPPIPWDRIVLRVLLFSRLPLSLFLSSPLFLRPILIGLPTLPPILSPSFVRTPTCPLIPSNSLVSLARLSTLHARNFCLLSPWLPSLPGFSPFPNTLESRTLRLLERST